MASKNVAVLEPKTGEREFKPSKGTRKYIRRLKSEGRLKEATLVRNEAKAHQNGASQKAAEKVSPKAE